MKQRLTVLTACAAVTLFGWGCRTSGTANTSPTGLTPRAAVDELLAADRAFSAASAKTDLITGVTAMLTPDVIMPAPGPAFAEGVAKVEESLRSAAANITSRMEWTPIRGIISADGLHGVTFGFTTVRRADNTVLDGKYMSYWIKGPKGWRVAVYKRSARAAGEISLAMMLPGIPERLVAPVNNEALINGYRQSVAAVEKAFSDEAQVIGVGPAFAKYGSEDAVNMGGPAQAGYVVGAANIGGPRPPNAPPTPFEWSADKVIVASSGDLGVSIGRIRPHALGADGKPQLERQFFTVWRRPSVRDPWRYVAE